MSSAQGIAAGVVALAAFGGAAIEATRPPEPQPPVTITRLEWDGERIIYERHAKVTTLAAWRASVLIEGKERQVCEGDGSATYERGAVAHAWSLATITGDPLCAEKIAPGQEYYVLVTIAPLDGRPSASRRSGPFVLK